MVRREVDERESGVRGVEPVSAADEQFDLVVERLSPGVAQLQATGGEYALTVFADRAAEADERGEPAAGEAGEQPVEQLLTASTVRPGAKIARTISFIAQARATFPPRPGSRRGGRLAVGEIGRVLEQRPAIVLELFGGAGLAAWRSSFQYSRRTSSSALVASCTTW